jgi:hypothetical protein
MLLTTLSTLHAIISIYGKKCGYPPTITSQLPMFIGHLQAATSPDRAIGLPSTVTVQLPFTIGCGNLCMPLNGACGIQIEP